MKVAISYGLFEGSWHGKKLRKELRRQGFTITKRLEQADIIIAHSGGVFFLPETTTASLVILIGIPHWPGKRILTSISDKFRLETKNYEWLVKTIHNLIYMPLYPLRWIKMYLRWKKLALPKTDSSRVVLVRNHDDTLLHPIKGQLLADLNGWHTISLPGQHDDIWINPEPYVQIIKARMKT